MPPHDSGVQRRATVAVAKAPTKGGEKAFTWEEVAAHNSENSAWVSYKGTVYDITPWLNKHPGGKEILLLVAGRDISYTFDSYHPFSETPEEMLKTMKVGTVITYEHPPYAPDSGFYDTLKKRVGKYFKDNKLDYKDPVPGAIRMALVLVTAYYTYYLAWGPENTYGFTVSFLLRCVAAAFFGILQALPLLHVMHDSSHVAFGHNQYFWYFGRFLMDYYAGASMTSWHNQHTIGHHIHTNVLMSDPDLPVAVSGDARRLVNRQSFASLYQYQHIYLPPLYGILGLKFRVQDFTDTFIKQSNGPIRVNPISTASWVQLIFSKLCWVFYRLYVPYAYFGLTMSSAVPLFFIAEFMTGYWLSFNFQVSHISTYCDYPNGDEDSDLTKIKDEWAVSQVKACVDYAHGNFFMTFLCGALNYQVVHHLFPCVSQYHYPALGPIVKEVCDQYKVPYTILPDFATAFKGHVDHLKNMGIKGHKAELPHMG